MQTLGQITEGQLVKLNESGVPVDFYVAKHDYEPDLNGLGRTLLVRKDVYKLDEVHPANINVYDQGGLAIWFEHVYFGMLDPFIAKSAQNTVIRLNYGGGNSSVSTASKSVFPLSLSEFGRSHTYATKDGTTLPIASTLRIAYLKGNPVTQWTRTPSNTSDSSLFVITDSGNADMFGTASSFGYRPCLTLPSTFEVGDDNVIKSEPMYLNDAPIGSGVWLKENGLPKRYIVVHKGKPASMYDDSCNGCWILRADLTEKGSWNESGKNTLDGSTIMNKMAEHLNLYEPGIQQAMKSAKIPYCIGGGSDTVKSGANGLPCKLFPLSWREVGYNSIVGEPAVGAKLDYFMQDPVSGNSYHTLLVRISTLNDVKTGWYCRDPDIQNKNETTVSRINESGDAAWCSAKSSNDVVVAYRPAGILPFDLQIRPDGLIQTTPEFGALPTVSMVGQTLDVVWSTMDGATSYTLQRKTDDGEWETIYTGPLTTYTDTVPDGSAIQYQVSATIDETPGAFGQSGVIRVISASVLAISGEDSDLGTITSDITYVVNTDTGNPITLTRTVNGQLAATLTVENGFAYDIPVMDLPTGTGTIVISASVEGGSGPISATRTWQYTKTPTTFPAGGSVAQMTQNSQNLFPLTLAEAVRVPANWGGSLDKALELLHPVVSSAVISVGTYQGTGTFGEDNPNTLTFDDTPLVVTVCGGGQTLVISSTDTGSAAYISGNQAIWYSTKNASAQMNTSGTTYSYVAVGKGQASA